VGPAVRGGHPGRREPHMILMIDNYDSFTFHLVQAPETAGAEGRAVRNDAISAAELEGLATDPTADLRGIVISPGPGNPDTAGDLVGAILGGRGDGVARLRGGPGVA